MNGAHLHLIVNHVSLFAMIFGTLALIGAMAKKSVDLRLAALILFLIAGVFGWVASETGELAEDIIKNLDSSSGSIIEEHALAAEWAERSGIFVAFLALAAEWTARKKKNWMKPLQWALLIFAIHGSTVFLRTAFLGGVIRHTEIRK